ncbi:hypothetical protein [Nioella sp. MMSF_3534]|uniref:hypothetical protein n=1 Tax=Nioella sp. MMSF_3534 TaxID=3046720 RepID=UPI00273ECD36|nr:hypothetical protein [Nioella sp. MMSF_3534]
MATLVELCESGELVQLEVPLAAHELPMRRLFAIPSFVRWLEESLGDIEHDDLYSDQTPLEQVDSLFFEYISGAVFSTDRRFKKLSSTPDHGIWELKSDDVRIFGWIPEKDAYVCCFGDSADRVKLLNTYGRYIAQSAFVRDNINLDEPKCVMSSEYDDVISTED